MLAPAASTSTSSSDQLRLVLVEDDALLCDLLGKTLRERFSPESFYAFKAAAPALNHCLEEVPHLVVTDLRLPDMDGRELIRRLRLREESVRFVVITNNITPVLPGELIALGVAGFVDKASTFEHIERAVQRVLAGGMYFSAEVSPAPSVYSKSPFGTDGEGPPPSVLSERESEIARMVAGGLLSKEIADRLELSVRTVEKERMRIMTKIGVRDLAGLIRWCLRSGLG